MQGILIIWFNGVYLFWISRNYFSGWTQHVPRGNRSLNEAYEIELIEWGEHEYIYMLHSTAEIAQLPCRTVRRQQIGFIVCLTLPMQGAS